MNSRIEVEKRPENKLENSGFSNVRCCEAFLGEGVLRNWRKGEMQNILF